MLGGLCAVLYENYKYCGLPFAITNLATIDPAGVVHLPFGSGFTCSTLLIGILEAMKVFLLDRSTWPAGDAEDVSWYRHLIDDHLASDALGNRNPEAHAAHVEFQRQNIELVQRFRPEDVAAAGSLFHSRPITRDEARPIATEMVDYIRAASGRSEA